MLLVQQLIRDGWKDGLARRGTSQGMNCERHHHFEGVEEYEAGMPALTKAPTSCAMKLKKDIYKNG